jgi:hypothetical protein
MLFRTPKILLAVGLGMLSHGAFAADLCKPGLTGISLIEGSHNPPGLLAPDTESLKPNVQWPNSLIEQGWHNLKKAERPLRLVCHYGGKRDEVITLPVNTGVCFLRPGLSVTCE